MANEIEFSYQSSRQAYALIRNTVGQIWNSSGAGAFEAYQSSHYASYTNQATEQGTASAYYTADFPTAITAGSYNIVAKGQIAGSPAETDPTVAVGQLEWNGAAVLPLSNLATSGQVAQFAPMRVARGTMIRNFNFNLVSSVDHVTPFTSGVISGQISRDGGAFGALQSGAYTELGYGWYALQALTSGDLSCGAAALMFNAVGVSGGTADQRNFSLITQRTSGY